MLDVREAHLVKKCFGEDMVPVTDVDIRIAVSPEMRELVARRKEDGINGALSRDEETNLISKSMNAGTSSTITWQEVKLQRDGQRPIMFHGVEIITLFNVISVPHSLFEQEAKLYLSSEDSIYISLYLSPCNDVPCRAWYRASRVDNVPVCSLLAVWTKELSVNLRSIGRDQSTPATQQIGALS